MVAKGSSRHTMMIEAAKKQDLTPELAKWAHEIRLGGNDAAHEEELFSEKEAKDLAIFTPAGVPVSLYASRHAKGSSRANRKQLADKAR